MNQLSSAMVYAALLYLFYHQATQTLPVKLSILFALSMICVFVEYFAFLRKQHLSSYQTGLYLILDFIHVFVFLGILMLVCVALRFKCNLNYLFLLNIFALFTTLLFFYFKTCVLTLLMYKIINVKNWINPIDRLKYLVGLDKYNIVYRKNVIDVNTWIRGQTIFFVTLLLMNIYYFVHKQRC